MAKETKTEKIVKLTLEAKENIEKELLELRTVKRKEIAEKIKVARSYGDLSENSEYDEAKNEQAMIEAKITELEQTLKVAVIIDANAGEANADKVRHGSVVKIRFTDTKEDKIIKIVNSFDVVNSDEDDGVLRVSEDSPIGAALIGKKAGGKVTVEAPIGELKIKIVELVK